MKPYEHIKGNGKIMKIAVAGTWVIIFKVVNFLNSEIIFFQYDSLPRWLFIIRGKKHHTKTLFDHIMHYLIHTEYLWSLRDEKINIIFN